MLNASLILSYVEVKLRQSETIENSFHIKIQLIIIAFNNLIG